MVGRGLPSWSWEKEEWRVEITRFQRAMESGVSVEMVFRTSTALSMM